MPVPVVAGALVLLVVAALYARHATGREHNAGIVASWTLTPGALNPEVTQQTIGSTICVRGWTRTIRPSTSYTNELKVRQMREYGLSGALSDFQEDHLISLELGGHPTDPRNLWPEPRPRADEVDGIENELHERICAGDLSLADAQERISRIKHESG